MEPSTDGKTKWIASFANGKKVRFGATGYLDYTIGATPEQRRLYLARHEKDLKTNDPHRPGYLSYYILWGPSRSMASNIKAYNKRFF
jgi:hypothetical protein